jgi:2-keto-4-pentenoate hydratase
MTKPTPVLSAREHARLAEVLHGAAANRRTLPPLTMWYPDFTDADACRIRDLLLGRRLADGELLIGAKVSLGDGIPRLAWLTDGMLLDTTAADVSGLTRPRVEPKLAFRLSRPLRGPIPTAGDILRATERVMPCLEIVDSRFNGHRTRPADDIAENGAAAKLLVGEGVQPPADGHLRRVRVQLRVDGRAFEPALRRGRADFPPHEAVSWLGGRLAAASLDPGPGTLLVSPAIGTAVDLEPGVRVIAHFSGLGTVQLDAIANT